MQVPKKRKYGKNLTEQNKRLAEINCNFRQKTKMKNFNSRLLRYLYRKSLNNKNETRITIPITYDVIKQTIWLLQQSEMIFLFTPFVCLQMELKQKLPFLP